LLLGGDLLTSPKPLTTGREVTKMETEDWFKGLLKSMKNDPEYLKEYIKLLEEEIDVLQLIILKGKGGSMMEIHRNVYKKLLEEQIEIALEEFEGNTNITITGITFKRTKLNEKEVGKEFKYSVNVSWKP